MITTKQGFGKQTLLPRWAISILIRDKIWSRRLGIGLMLGLMMSLGFWLRLRHLGDLGLIADEGNQAVAVQAILESGIPKVESGRVYNNIMVFLYIQALAAKLFGLNEFALRLPSVVFGVITIFVAYSLGKTVFNRQVGLLAAAIIAFSAWEIEMSRYARYYTLFQLTYLIALLCFYRGFILDERAYKFWFIGAAFISFLTHMLGVMLVTCFFAPLLSTAYSFRRKFISVLWMIGLGGLWAVWQKLNSLFLMMGDFYTPREGINAATTTVGKVTGMLSGMIPRIYRPELNWLALLMREDLLLLLGLALAPLAATLYLGYRFFRGKENGWQTLWVMAMIWAAFFHQFGFAVIIFVGHLIFFARNRRSLFEPALRVAYGAMTICLLFWIQFLAANSTLPARQIALLLFDYPRFYRYFLSWFVAGWPVLTIVVGLGSVLLLAQFISDRKTIRPLFVLGASFIPAILTSFLWWRFYQARYGFHLYPMMVVVFAFVWVQWSSYLWRRLSITGAGPQIALVAIIILAALFVSQDANPLTAWSIGNRTYQSPRDPIRAVLNSDFHGRFHQDQKTPSLYLQDRLGPKDQIVAMGASHQITVYHYYVGVDYTIERPGDAWYNLVGDDGRKISRMTGSAILTSPAELQALIAKESEGELWLLGDRLLLLAEYKTYPEPLKAYVRSLVQQPDYVGLDGQTFAVRLR